jgi:hypothetical protein
MVSSVSGKYAFARQISLFARGFVVSHFGSTAPALAVKRVSLTNGIARPAAMSGRPRESQDAATRLYASRMESGFRSSGVDVRVAVLMRAGMTDVSRISITLKMPLGCRCQRICVPLQMLVMNA